MIDHQHTAMTPPAPTGLREPAHHVSPRAVKYWRTSSIINNVIWLGLLGIGYGVLTFFVGFNIWATLAYAVFIALAMVSIFIAPGVRYRIHRWEVDDTAVHTRSGFINIESRIAPVNRIQTVDSSQGWIMRMYNLSSITVTTASSAGAIEIDCLDAEEAARVVAHLTAIAAAVEGDAT